MTIEANARDGLRTLATILQVAASRVTCAATLSRTIDVDTLREVAEVLRGQANVLDDWLGVLGAHVPRPHDRDRGNGT